MEAQTEFAEQRRARPQGRFTDGCDPVPRFQKLTHTRETIEITRSYRDTKWQLPSTKRSTSTTTWVQKFYLA